MQIYPVTDRIVVSIHSQDRLGAIDPEAPGKAITPITSRGARPRIAEFAALEYSARMESLIYFSSFGRFRVAQFESYDLAILVRHVDTPVYCLRLPNS